MEFYFYRKVSVKSPYPVKIILSLQGFVFFNHHKHADFKMPFEYNIIALCK